MSNAYEKSVPVKSVRQGARLIMSNAYEKSVPVKSVRKGHLHCFLQNVIIWTCVTESIALCL